MAAMSLLAAAPAAAVSIPAAKLRSSSRRGNSLALRPSHHQRTGTRTVRGVRVFAASKLSLIATGTTLPHPDKAGLHRCSPAVAADTAAVAVT